MLKSKGSKNSKSHELLAVDNVDDVEMQLESLDVADNVIHDEHAMSNVDLNDSHTIYSVDNADNSKSKLREISDSLTLKIKSNKMKKRGFEKIVDEDYSDKDDDIVSNTNITTITTTTAIQTNTKPMAVNQTFDINICHRTCHCTKTKTIICIMSILLFFLVLFTVILVQTFSKSNNDNNQSLNCMHGQKVLIISMDGFRAEYLQRIETPNIDKYFIQQGVFVKSLKPVYPSKTFPNHYSTVTGLYPPSHGIVANHFWDPVLKKKFDIQYQGNDSSGEWFKGEPIWNTIKLKNLTSAALQYPGSAANCGGRVIDGKDLSGHPTYHRPHYHNDWPFEDRINLALDLLKSRQPNYDLLLLYFEQPDHDGHEYGPNSANVNKTVQKMDKYIGYLMEQMEKYNLIDITDIILLSDHGMTSIEHYNKETYLNEDSKIIVVNTSMFPFDTNDIIIRDWSPIMGVYLNESSDRFTDAQQAMQLMREAIVHNGDKCKMYENGNIPYNTYNNIHDYHNRIPDFIIDSDLGYSIFVDGYHTPTLLGTHGYNNSKEDMHGIFMARGPSFKSGYAIKDKYIENIHLYEMFCNLLCGVKPNENNGSGSYSQQLFTEDDKSNW